MRIKGWLALALAVAVGLPCCAAELCEATAPTITLTALANDTEVGSVVELAYSALAAGAVTVTVDGVEQVSASGAGCGVWRSTRPGNHTFVHSSGDTLWSLDLWVNGGTAPLCAATAPTIAVTALAEGAVVDSEVNFAYAPLGDGGVAVVIDDVEQVRASVAGEGTWATTQPGSHTFVHRSGKVAWELELAVDGIAEDLCRATAPTITLTALVDGTELDAREVKLGYAPLADNAVTVEVDGVGQVVDAKVAGCTVWRASQLGSYTLVHHSGDTVWAVELVFVGDSRPICLAAAATVAMTSLSEGTKVDSILGFTYAPLADDGVTVAVDGAEQVAGATMPGSGVWRASYPGRHVFQHRSGEITWSLGLLTEGDLPILGEKPTAAEVAAVVAGAADSRLVANVDEVNYASFRAWAETVKAVDGETPAGAQGVLAAATAWESYALDLGALLAEPLAEEDVAIAAFEPAAEAGKFEVTVAIADVEVGPAATAENLKRVLGLEGAATLEGSGFSADQVVLEAGEPVDGKVKFTVRPTDAKAEAFFLKVKLQP